MAGRMKEESGLTEQMLADVLEIVAETTAGPRDETVAVRVLFCVVRVARQVAVGAEPRLRVAVGAVPLVQRRVAAAPVP